jgi:hypothetical protein
MHNDFCNYTLAPILISFHGNGLRLPCSDVSENFLCSMAVLLVIIVLPLDALDVRRNSDVSGTKIICHKHILLYFLIIKPLICIQY